MGNIYKGRFIESMLVVHVSKVMVLSIEPKIINAGWSQNIGVPNPM